MKKPAPKMKWAFFDVKLLDILSNAAILVGKGPC